MKKFEIGYYIENEFNKFYDRIMFPLRDINGDFITHQGRTLVEDFKAKGLKKYQHGEYEKNKYLYGLYDVGRLIKEKGYVVLTEGPFDVLAAYEQGIPAVSGFGVTFSAHQAMLTAMYTDKVYLAYDADEAGLGGAKTAKANLKPFLLKVIDLKLKKDLSDLHMEDYNLCQLIS
ncbi:MAG TPA: toprim domain-containing protein [Aquella sp.]|nr:toprim domain-containing protein [Aquella sp.]